MSIAGNISFLVNGYELADALKSYKISLKLDELDASVLANNFRSYEAGYATGTLDTSGIWDADTTNEDKIHDILSTAFNDQGTNTICSSVGTVSTGSFAFILNGCQVTYNVDTVIGQLIIADANFQSKTGLDFGVWLMNTAAAAGTTTGTSVDNAAASSNGGFFVVQLHNDDASDVDVKIQHSTDNSVWADLVTISNLSAEHESGYATVATGTTVRRYIRAVATVTGGDTILLSAAFARR